MDHPQLDELIDELQALIHPQSSILFKVDTNDWRPAFAKAKQIQAGFSAGVRYPTKELREAAWRRFNGLRSLAFERANKERERRRFESQQLRNEIMGMLKHADWSQYGEFLMEIATMGLSAFSNATAEDIKAKGFVAKEAGQKLSKNKERMLPEHKAECFERIQVVRESHNAFWNKHREAIEARRLEARQKRMGAAHKIESNITANREKRAKAMRAAERVESNIEENNARLSKSLDARERVEGNIERNREKLDGARSEEFAQRISGWIEEDEEKLADIDATIQKIRDWIAEGEQKLADIRDSTQRIEGWIREEESRLNEIHRRL